ncbi:Gibberellin regulated protein [Cynara cardunculus var. scolymus]|uniref:Gibberellin regulated protein n=1 Tax=Cynara cardunculus var. scolymus TaxID=59895 RepID=A0A103YH29_CYNCS|nr:Gibberellin regulated protein [Cynara cardunculus var. scolymus]
MKTLFPFAFLLIAALLLISSGAATSPAPSPAPSQSAGTFGCDNKCANRCANAGYKERCLKYCGICCGKCKGCVPSTPYAPKSQCPCYQKLKNSKGTDKCP